MNPALLPYYVILLVALWLAVSFWRDLRRHDAVMKRLENETYLTEKDIRPF